MRTLFRPLEEEVEHPGLAPPTSPQGKFSRATFYNKRDGVFARERNVWWRKIVADTNGERTGPS